MPTTQELEDFGNYLASFDIGRDALRAEMTYLESIWKGISGSMSEKALARAATEELEKKMLLLEASHAGILQRFETGAQPPTADVIQKAHARAEKLASDIRKNVVITTLLETAAKFVTAWSKL